MRKLLLALYVIAISSESISAGGTFSVQDVRDGLEQRSVAMKGISVIADYTASSAEPGKEWKVIQRYHLCLDRLSTNERARYTELDGNNAVICEREYTWDGTKYMSRAMTPADGGKAIQSGDIESLPGGAMRVTWRTAFEGQTLDTQAPIVVSSKADVWESAGTKMIGGVTAWGIKTKVRPDTISTEIWVDPARDFVPVEVSETLESAGKKLTAVMRYDECVKSDKVWVPMRMVLTGKNQFNGETESKHEIIVRSYKTGLALGASTFEIAFPHGTPVWDNVHQRSLVVGTGVWVADKTGTVHLKGLSDEKIAGATDEPSVAGESLSKARGRQFFGVGGIACGILLATYCALAYKRRSGAVK